VTTSIPPPKWTAERNGAASARVRTVIANVRRLRKQQGWTVQHLGDRMAAAGCPLKRSVLTNLEHGRRDNITIDELWAFAELFGLTVEELVVPVCEVCNCDPPQGFICAACGRKWSE